MRILAVHLRNLNSLAGSWSIDFTAPEYTASGIFAITGPTGAGKSTLLDAICLALFGRTPRLGSITKGSNEIMSRRAGDCFAEVSFSTKKGQFRCHWGQHRAHRKPGGELQTPRHEMVDLKSGKVLENRSREVVRMVEQVTGMDYDRFTRSILLAQGDFAAFLEADADQRAPILEQITGTGIYSRLSVAVHERTSEERRKTAALQEALGAVKLLGAEEEEEIAAAIAANTGAVERLRRQHEQVESSLQRLARIEALKGEMNETENGLTRLAEQRQQAEPDLQRLEQGQRALVLAPLHAALVQLREQIKALEQKELQRSGTLLALQQTRQQLHHEHVLALEQLNGSRATWEREQERIKEVRALDLQLHEKKQRIGQVAAAVAQLEQERQTINREREAGRQQLVGLHDQEEQVRRFLSQHAGDALLVEQMAGLRQQLLHLEHKERERAHLHQAMSTTRQEHQQANSRQQQLDQGVEEAADALNRLRQDHQRLQQERDHLLGGHALPELRQECARQEARLQQLERAADLHQRLHAIQEEQGREAERGKQLRSRHQQFLARLRQLEEQGSLRRQLVEQCEQNHQMSLRIHSYEQERARLEQGQPCPLCGATDHPWTTDAPLADDSATRLHQARAELEQGLADIARQREALAVLNRDLEHAAEAQSLAARRIEELSRQLVPLLSGHDLGPVSGCAPALAAALETGRQQAETLRTRLAAIDQVDAQLQTSIKRVEQGAGHHAEATQQAQANRQALATVESDIRNLETRQRESEVGLASACDELTGQLQPLGITQFQPQAARELVMTLETRLQGWKTQSARLEALERQKDQLTSALDKQALQCTGLEAQLTGRNQERATLAEEQGTLQKQRHKLYEKRDPDVEEQRLRALVQQAEDGELAARTRLAASEKELHSLSEQQRLDREELQELIPKHTDREAELEAKVRTAGFADLAGFAAAILPPETLQQLEQVRRQLEQQQSLLATRKKEQAEALKREEAGLDQAKTQTDLQTEKEALRQQVEALQQRIGADRERLAANERLAHQFERQRQDLASQQREQERWELLHHLIGSADGKKFRVFAQGLTFEVMVSHANRQLRKMSDRYILLRDPGEPLALQVIDNYQAGEIRSTRNLSGGESFLVSLALSLGLSAMSSHNVRVDSLFLDEGFGTLDEETLDVALQTLAELRQDGKLIGIISHVPLLKDRIDLRIQVQPGADGCSRLVGPGCRQLA